MRLGRRLGSRVAPLASGVTSASPPRPRRSEGSLDGVYDVVSVSPEYRAEPAALREWKEERISMMELMTRLETLHRKQIQAGALKAYCCVRAQRKSSNKGRK